MRSPVEPGGRSVRPAAEAVCRLAALALLGWLLWGALWPQPPSARHARTDTAGLDAALVAWSVNEPPDTVHLELHAAPDPVQRAWLAALRRGGVALGWADAGVAPIAVELHASVDPLGGARALVAAPDGEGVALTDALGALDTLRTAAGGGVAWVPEPAGPVTAHLAGTRASATLRDSLAPRPLLLLGAAGWEARFVIAALEERGWTVHSRLRVAPGLEVSGGPPLALDTANYAAVLALDATAADHAAPIARFVASGGGLVLAGTATQPAALRRLAPGTAGADGPAPALPIDGVPADAMPRHTPLRELRGDALVLDGDQPGAAADAAVSVAARREGAGRVVQVGYLDTWRWRMTGDDDAPAAHRAWWSELVAGAAYRPAHARDAPTGDPAPRAALFDALGPPGPAAVPAAAAAALPRRGPPRWALPLLLALLLGEWASRRLRGAR